MKRSIPVVSLAALVLALVTALPATAATPNVKGTVGPGFTIKIAKKPTRPIATASGALTPSATTAPSTTTENAIPTSTNGTGTPAIPSAPPAAITRTNVVGTSQSARPPSW